MQCPTRSHAASTSPWGVVLAALMLLSGSFGAQERSPSASLDASGLVGSHADSRAPAPMARSDIIGVLSRWNPRLDPLDSARVTDAILRCSAQWDLDRETVLAVLLVESHARPSALSRKGAVGLMQVMPHMFEQLELPGNVAHIETNVEAGCILLADNIRRLGEADGISTYFWGSWIRGDGYLRRVLRVRDDLMREREPESARRLG
jgi:soluble lytic murein transglycosylase-like protein